MQGWTKEMGGDKCIAAQPQGDLRDLRRRRFRDFHRGLALHDRRRAIDCFHSVVCCNGHFSVPNWVPQLEKGSHADFKGRVIHARRDAQDFKGQRLLLIGKGREISQCVTSCTRGSVGEDRPRHAISEQVRSVDGVEIGASIQDENAVNLISTQATGTFWRVPRLRPCRRWTAPGPRLQRSLDDDVHEKRRDTYLEWCKAKALELVKLGKVEELPPQILCLAFYTFCGGLSDLLRVLPAPPSSRSLVLRSRAVVLSALDLRLLSPQKTLNALLGQAPSYA